MDERDLEILKILQDKARIPNVEVSRMINLAPSAVLERIRKMESQGIIDGYEVRLNPERFNYKQISFIHVFLETGADTDGVGNALSSISEVQEVHFIAGKDCYLIKIRTSDTSELGSFVHNRIKTIRGVLKTETFPVLSTKKETARIPVTL